MKIKVHSRFYSATLPVSKKIVPRCSVVEVSDEEGKAALKTGFFHEVSSDVKVPVLAPSRLEALKKAIVGGARSDADRLQSEAEAKKNLANTKRSETMKKKFILKKAEELAISVDKTMTIDAVAQMVKDKETALKAVVQTEASAPVVTPAGSVGV